MMLRDKCKLKRD